MKPLFIVVIVLLSSCAQGNYCHTYDKTYSKNHRKMNTQKDKFSLAEKTGAVLFTIFAIYCIENSRDASKGD